jgi:hypothetical protein
LTVLIPLQVLLNFSTPLYAISMDFHSVYRIKFYLPKLLKLVLLRAYLVELIKQLQL